MKDAGGHGSNAQGARAAVYAKRGFTDGSGRKDIGWHWPTVSASPSSAGAPLAAHSSGIVAAVKSFFGGDD
jgi:hypothetical protein